MIKYIKTFVKIFEGLMWLYLPVVMIYWSLSLIELNAIIPLKATIGVIIMPLVIIIDKYFDFQFVFRNTEVDYTPVILAGAVTVSALLAMFASNVLDFIEEKLEIARIEILKQKEIKTKAKEKKMMAQELNRNKILYVMLKLKKVQRHETYLINNDKDSFTVGLIDSYENTIKNIAKNFSGKEYKGFDAGSEVSNFVFTDTEQFLLYLHYLNEKVKEINKGTADDLNTIFSYGVACSCSQDFATVKTDFQLTGKILNLVGSEEIFITSILKQKLKNLDTDINMKFESKGVYILDNKDFDIFKLKLE